MHYIIAAVASISRINSMQFMCLFFIILSNTLHHLVSSVCPLSLEYNDYRNVNSSIPVITTAGLLLPIETTFTVSHCLNHDLIDWQYKHTTAVGVVDHSK